MIGKFSIYPDEDSERYELYHKVRIIDSYCVDYHNYWKYNPYYGDDEDSKPRYIFCISEIDEYQEIAGEIDEFSHFGENYSFNFFMDVGLVDYTVAVMNAYHFLTSSQKEMIIKRNLFSADKLLNAYFYILTSEYCSRMKDDPYIKYFITRANDKYSKNFVDACYYLNYAFDIPVMINEIKEDSFNYFIEEDFQFLKDKIQLHLLDYEILLREILLPEVADNDIDVQRNPAFDKLENEGLLTYMGNGKYMRL